MTPSRGRSGTWLSDETEVALFEELQARGAFDKALPSVRAIKFQVDDKDLWDILRLETGGVWRPRVVGHGAIVASGWALDDGTYLASMDTEGYRGKIANSRGTETRR